MLKPRAIVPFLVLAVFFLGQCYSERGGSQGGHAPPLEQFDHDGRLAELEVEIGKCRDANSEFALHKERLDLLIPGLLSQQGGFAEHAETILHSYERMLQLRPEWKEAEDAMVGICMAFVRQGLHDQVVEFLRREELLRDDAHALAASRELAYYLALSEDSVEEARAQFRRLAALYPNVEDKASCERWLHALDSFMPGAKFPSFKANDLNGAEVSLDELAGSCFLVVFARTDCRSCDFLPSEFSSLVNVCRGESVRVILVVLDEAEVNSEPPDVVEDYGADHVLVFPMKGPRDRNPGPLVVTWYPAAVLVGQDGRVLACDLCNSIEVIRDRMTKASSR